MNKKLINPDNIAGFIDAEANEIHLDGSMILTSSAKDYLREKKVKIIYASKAATTCPPQVTGTRCKQEKLKAVVTRIVSILRNDLQVRDTGVIERVTQTVLSSLQR